MQIGFLSCIFVDKVPPTDTFAVQFQETEQVYQALRALLTPVKTRTLRLADEQIQFLSVRKSIQA